MIVSPDVGGVVRARALANRLGADLAIVDKRREKAGVSDAMHIICLLYTSDAADERSSADFGGRRTIQKNKYDPRHDRQLQ